MRRMTWLDEILPWRNRKGWCMALALVLFWGAMQTAAKREKLELLRQYGQMAATAATASMEKKHDTDTGIGTGTGLDGF